MLKIVSTSILGVAALLALPASAASPARGVLHVFNEDDGDGTTPLAGVIADQAGNLYGTTFAGGANRFGTVFRLSPPPPGSKVWTETLLHEFPSSPADGALLQGTLVMDTAGALYGTTETGGSGSGFNALGIVFKLTPPAPGSTAWVETVLHTFGAPSDGVFPSPGLITGPGGVLYGVTFNGGSNDAGTVFKMTPPAPGQTVWTETVLYSFAGGATDGKGPNAKLIMDQNGALYGTTQNGGGTYTNQCGYGCGTVFKLTPPAAGQTAWTEAVIHIFAARSGGIEPEADLVIDKSGSFYGTTLYGGLSNQCKAGCGTVFKLTPPSPGATVWPYTIIHSFTAVPDGAHPRAGLTMDAAGNFFGTTAVGGIAVTNCAYGCGTVFKLSPPGAGQTDWTETVMATPTEAGGHSPIGDLLLRKGGLLYGVNEIGPKGRDQGTVFRLRSF